MKGDFRIGHGTVVPTLNQIRRDGSTLHVEPKSMRVLLYLASRRGEVARREELFQEVWPDTFVTDDVLKRCISDLRKALGDDRKNARFIETIPKVGYRLVAPVEPAEPEEEATAQPPAATSLRPVAAATGRTRAALAAAGAVLLGGAAAIGLSVWRRDDVPDEPRLVQLSSERQAASAAFSPDARQIAFDSPGAGDNWDIWLRIVGEAETRRLTTSEAPDAGPEWSPDGKLIAFVRFEELRAVRGATDRGVGTIYVVSPIGGAERRLLDFPVRGASLSWSPDGRWLAVGKAAAPGTFFGTGIHLIPVAGGEPRQVTFPSAAAFDSTPAFSPDGSTLAYFSCEGAHPGYSCNVWVLPIDDDGKPRDEPRCLTKEGVFGMGLAWARDGRSVIYSSYAARFSRLWRVRADGSAPPERVDLAGLGAVNPTTARCCDRLAYVRVLEDTDIYRFEEGASAIPLIASAASDFNPQYSPDGEWIVFTSSRADEHDEIWLVQWDASTATRLTRGPGRFQGSPRWSPDSRTIAFDSQAASGHWDIWTIGVDGSGLRQLTHDLADENMPSWSQDGKFVYYGSNRTGNYEIWRIAVTDGVEERITQSGGYLPFESRDGRTLYYLTKRGGALLAKPTTGGEERRVVECIDTWAYAIAPGGFFHFDCPPPDAAVDAPRTLRYWNAATAQDREVASLDAGSGGILGLSASPDGRSVLYSRFTSAFDLMMLDNFR